MPKVVYVLPDGSTNEVDVPVGQSVMDGSVRNNLPGIVAECGGSCSCATCHVHLDEQWWDFFDEPSDEENELLEFAEGAQSNSRLSCQLIVSDACDGVQVTALDNDG
ncbi:MULTISPECIES: 2Fe-2S iron-sulfur cluster-binding protein [unclassified Saccharopolyspora]|uniref:2Fe-2S iron-sulfur cluster-binding protein n=1 Tax=Saccharopolyspora TaxID=1835 RepID=UPI00190B80E9|nr:2Fe-2S iron-sulfur cluster-binding protein [Saccharopolyspora sp. HNM0986]MBK0870781.1 2Fe-2S iron-sulfur cluster binding domain-containing protein [Saccharopolyspora sp. HNM0986]